MQIISNKRKLVPRKVLLEIICKIDLGIPLARVLRDLDLDACRPLISKLIDSYKLAHDNDLLFKARYVVDASLFPEWLKETPNVQEQPDGWKYAGRFPTGKWLSPKEVEKLNG